MNLQEIFNSLTLLDFVHDSSPFFFVICDNKNDLQKQKRDDEVMLFGRGNKEILF